MRSTFFQWVGVLVRSAMVGIAAYAVGGILEVSASGKFLGWGWFQMAVAGWFFLFSLNYWAQPNLSPTATRWTFLTVAVLGFYPISKLVSFDAALGILFFALGGSLYCEVLNWEIKERRLRDSDRESGIPRL